MQSKSLKIFLIIILSILTLTLIIFFINILNNKNFQLKNLNFGYKTSNTVVYSEEYETVFNTIKIDTKASQIKIKEANENKVKVVIYGDKEKSKIEMSNNRLEIISNKNPCVGFCFNQQLAKIELYLPNNYEGNITIINNYGDIKIGSFDRLILNASLDAGDIEVDSLLKGKIKNSFGDIIINGYSKELKITQACGEVKVDKVDRIQVENNYGSIEINSVEEYIKVKEDCGDVRIKKINLKENSTIHNSYGDIEIDSTNEIFISAKTNLGDTTINHNYPKSDIKLDIDNSCGDIKINN